MPPASGERPAGKAARSNEQHLRRKCAEEERSEQAVDDPARVGRAVETERPQAVVRDRDRQQECQGAARAMDAPEPARPVPASQATVELRRRQHLEDGEHDGGRREPDLEVDGGREEQRHEAAARWDRGPRRRRPARGRRSPRAGGRGPAATDPVRVPPPVQRPRSRGDSTPATNVPRRLTDRPRWRIIQREHRPNRSGFRHSDPSEE